MNVLKNSSKISNLIMTDVFQLNLSEINDKLGWKSCPSGFGNIGDPVTRWLRKDVLKVELSGIRWTTFFGVNNFGYH